MGNGGGMNCPNGNIIKVGGGAAEAQKGNKTFWGDPSLGEAAVKNGEWRN
jgi:hypothetical protein